MRWIGTAAVSTIFCAAVVYQWVWCSAYSIHGIDWTSSSRRFVSVGGEQGCLRSKMHADGLIRLDCVHHWNGDMDEPSSIFVTSMPPYPFPTNPRKFRIASGPISVIIDKSGNVNRYSSPRDIYYGDPPRFSTSLPFWILIIPYWAAVTAFGILPAWVLLRLLYARFWKRGEGQLCAICGYDLRDAGAMPGMRDGDGRAFATRAATNVLGQVVGRRGENSDAGLSCSHVCVCMVD